jgi:hypothetical protein
MILNEEHPATMSTSTHEVLHHGVGTIWESGLATSVVGDGVGDTDDDLQTDISGGDILDESLVVDITDGAGVSLFEQILTPSELPIVHLEGANGYLKKIQATPFNVHLEGGDTYPSWNEFTGGAWKLTQGINNRYIVYYVFATTTQDEPLFLMMGQANYSTLIGAQSASVNELSLSSIPFQELSPIAKLIVKSSAAYTNSYKSAIVEVVDLRGTTASIVVTGAVNSHPSLSGRSDPGQHPASAIDFENSSVEDILKSGWVELTPDDYTSTPTDTNTLAMSDTSLMSVGKEIKFTIGGSDFLAFVESIDPDVSIDVRGEPLSGDVTALYVSTINRTFEVEMFVSGEYGDGTDTDLLDTDMDTAYVHRGKAARIVSFEAYQKSVDTGTEPKVNVNTATGAVSTNDGNLGIQLGAAKTWVQNSGVAINITNNRLSDGDSITAACTAAGGTGDARNLTVKIKILLD